MRPARLGRMPLPAIPAQEEAIPEPAIECPLAWHSPSPVVPAHSIAAGCALVPRRAGNLCAAQREQRVPQLEVAAAAPDRHAAASIVVVPAVLEWDHRPTGASQ